MLFENSEEGVVHSSILTDQLIKRHRLSDVILGQSFKHLIGDESDQTNSCHIASSTIKRGENFKDLSLDVSFDRLVWEEHDRDCSSLHTLTLAPT